MIKRYKWFFLTLSFLALPVYSVSSQPVQSTANSNSSAKLPSDMDKLSYTLGVKMGENFKQQGVQVNPDLMLQGMKDYQDNKQLLLTPDEMEKTLVSFQRQFMLKKVEQFKALANQNAQEGKNFLGQNAQQNDVKKFSDGLQYKVINAGNGASPLNGDIVTVDYEGKFINGKVFDSSYKRGKPTTFPLTEVIQGWQEALKQMKEGATWEIYVPSQLAYGEQGLGDLIGPNKTLIFKIHLISIKKKS